MWQGAVVAVGDYCCQGMWLPWGWVLGVQLSSCMCQSMNART